VNDIPKYFPRLFQFVSLKIIQSSHTILQVFDAALQAKGLERLQKIGIDVLLESRVQEVQDREVVLQGGATVPYGLCVWAAGTGAWNITKQLVAKLPEQANAPGFKRGQLTVDSYLRVLGGNGTILALGDCAQVNGAPLPSTGQVAAQQGAYVSRLLNRGYNLTTAIPCVDDDGDLMRRVSNFVRLRGKLRASRFEFLNLGILAYIGDDQALAQVSAGNSQLVSASGELGYLLWRSVYTVKQVSFRNRVLVLFDWFKSQVFGRDISRF
jgi:NADH dehydrogenase FAD-containing subunit